jgi:hypothetical protein
MPYQCPQGPFLQACLDREAFLSTGAKIDFFLGIFFSVCGTMIDWYFELGVGENALIIPYIWTVLWGLPLNMYFVYHRVTLPTWLTFGHPVTFGGILPNVDDESATTKRPCLPRDWHKFMNGNWPENHVVFYLALNLGLFTWIFCTLRNARRRNALKNDEKCEHLEAGAKSSELGDLEKQ